ncbi:MAG: aminopeptidase [Candidatus Peribacteraceae bacterium]|nr:aminopeptidase [Candidatus Peribacteraceae bacterium]
MVERIRTQEENESFAEKHVDLGPLHQGAREKVHGVLAPKRPKGVSEAVWEECRGNGWKVFQDYLDMKAGKHVLFITDETPATDRRLIEALRQALEHKGVIVDEVLLTEKTNRKDMLKKIARADVLWSATDFDLEPVEWDEIVERVEKSGKRFAHCPGVSLESLRNDGAFTEDRSAMEERIAKMIRKLRPAVGFHITSSYGTDLIVRLKHGDRRWCGLNGVIQPGQWSNLPEGEVFTTPDEEHVDGVLVLPVLQDEITRAQGVDEWVRLTIHHGKIVKIDGGTSAERLRRYLIANAANEKNPYNVLQCAEIAFGANSKARSVVRSPKKTRRAHGNSTLEAEKRLGTMHFAFGDTKHGEEGTEGHTEADIHLDFIIPRNGLTVTAFTNDHDFERRKNGVNLIHGGSWGFLS